MIKPDAVISGIMEEKNFSNTKLANDIGMSRQSLHQIMSRNPDGMKLNTFQKILEAMGYEIQVVKKPE